MDRPRVDFHPQAASEACAAFEWYRARNPNAASAFESELDRAISSIRQSPERYAAYLHGTRRYLMLRFPYLVVYRIDHNGDILIVAIAHGRRRPGYWRNRSTDKTD